MWELKDRIPRSARCAGEGSPLEEGGPDLVVDPSDPLSPCAVGFADTRILSRFHWACHESKLELNRIRHAFWSNLQITRLVFSALLSSESLGRFVWVILLLWALRRALGLVTQCSRVLGLCIPEHRRQSPNKAKTGIDVVLLLEGETIAAVLSDTDHEGPGGGGYAIDPAPGNCARWLAQISCQILRFYMSSKYALITHFDRRITVIARIHLSSAPKGGSGNLLTDLPML